MVWVEINAAQHPTAGRENLSAVEWRGYLPSYLYGVQRPALPKCGKPVQERARGQRVASVPFRRTGTGPGAG